MKGEADHVLLPGERLLNGEVYLSVTSVSIKRHRTFWGFQHGEEIIRKHDGISCWLCSFCEAVDVTKIFSTTSTVWIGNHLRKKHQQRKPSSSPDKTISSCLFTCNTRTACTVQAEVDHVDGQKAHFL